MKATYISHYLTDRDIANFARQSFADVADNFTEAQNNNLVEFLARGMRTGEWEKLLHTLCLMQNPVEVDKMAKYLRKIATHWVPFGHPQITLRMTAPVPIRVQCFKHKVGFVESEESRRYISTKPEFFMPEFFREKAENVKQGSAGKHPNSDAWKDEYEVHMNSSIYLYEDMIKNGVCPEQARFVLPQGCEVNWVWTGSLYAYANYFNQRSDPHAQMESQILAKEAADIIEPLFPVAWKALTS